MGVLTGVASVATVVICILTFITFGISTGMWEEDFWRSDLEDASILGIDGYWGEDIVVTYLDGSTGSVKGISNNYWDTMSIQNDGSELISDLQYCLNVRISTAETFDTQGYSCEVSIAQGNNVFYQTIKTYDTQVETEANEWTRIITVPLDIQQVTDELPDGNYTVSFGNTGNIADIDVPSGRYLDIVIENGEVSFLI